MPQHRADHLVMPRLRRDHFLDLRPFAASPAFTRMWIGSTLAGLGGQLTIVAVMLQMYELTNRPSRCR